MESNREVTRLAPPVGQMSKSRSVDPRGPAYNQFVFRRALQAAECFVYGGSSLGLEGQLNNGMNRYRSFSHYAKRRRLFPSERGDREEAVPGLAVSGACASSVPVGVILDRHPRTQMDTARMDTVDR